MKTLSVAPSEEHIPEDIPIPTPLHHYVRARAYAYVEQDASETPEPRTFVV